MRVGLVERCAVDVDLLLADLERLARQADDALDEIALGLHRVLEDDHVASVDLANGEERAFRGLIYTGLRKTLGVSESFIISSFAFALLHLSIPSLITHLPLGLYFCYLRHRADSLWPAMLAHALHNAGVIAVSYLGWT